MMFSRLIGSGGILALCVALCYGQDSSAAIEKKAETGAETTSEIKISAHGQAAMEFGQIVHGYDHADLIDHVVFDKIYLTTGLNVDLSPSTKFTGNLEVKAFNEFPRTLESGYTRRYYYYFYLTQAELSHQFVNIDGLQVDAGLGYFPYKYDENVQNLGEYLFRSTAYPQTLTTEFDFAFARLAGFYGRGRYSSGLNTLKLDLLATINTEWMAIGDLNVSAIASYNFAKIFEIGAGVEFCSVISADEDFTTPQNANTRYASGTDTGYYTFRGTKLMGRASIDFKKFFPLSTLLGDKDLVLYTEAALLGVKNYDAALQSPIWYNSILERIPAMFGLNLPAFKILDVLSCEAEWWGNRYPNSMDGIIWEGLPLPFKTSIKSLDDTTIYKNDNWKWSVYGAKTFANHYRLAFQVASDHMRTFAWDWYRQDLQESLRGPDKWCYTIKFGVLF